MFAELSNEEELFLADLLNKPREFLMAHPEILKNPEKLLSPERRKKFILAKRRLRQGLPLAYILGYKWFYGEKFAVNKNTLIPRPETEILVEKALEIAAHTNPKTIIDIGTGSGAIIVSLRKNFSKNAKFYASDISKKALEIARKNAKILTPSLLARGKAIKFLHGNLLTPFKKFRGSEKILICANLPYLSKKELQESSIKHEPGLALYGGKKSTDKIELLLRQIKNLRLRQSTAILEIGFSQAHQIKNLAKKYLPAAKITIYKDLGGFNRIALLSW